MIDILGWQIVSDKKYEMILTTTLLLDISMLNVFIGSAPVLQHAGFIQLTDPKVKLEVHTDSSN